MDNLFLKCPKITYKVLYFRTMFAAFELLNWIGSLRNSTLCWFLLIRGVLRVDSLSLGGQFGGGGKNSLQLGRYDPTVTPLPELDLDLLGEKWASLGGVINGSEWSDSLPPLALLELVLWVKKSGHSAWGRLRKVAPSWNTTIEINSGWRKFEMDPNLHKNCWTSIFH